MKRFLKMLAHGAIGAAAVAVAQQVADPHTAITSGNVLLPALASAVTSVVSLVTTAPKDEK